MTDSVWNTLISRINDGKCTPFLGAGACSGTLPLAKEIAEDLAKEFNYPLQDREDLIKVSQYISITIDRNRPKEKLLEKIKNAGLPDFRKENEPHWALADLPFPMYITTNYDDFMFQALRLRRKFPKRILCQWNNYIEKHEQSYKLSKSCVPDLDNPIVFHLHGINDIADSLVLTEDDYIDFMVQVTKKQNSIIPHQIQRALTGTSLLFIGYSLSDWNFRVIFRSLINQLGYISRTNIAVQLGKDDENQTKYLEKYFKEMKIEIFWGTASEFIEQLSKRWKTYVDEKR
jgi:hypothetical protein